MNQRNNALQQNANRIIASNSPAINSSSKANSIGSKANFAADQYDKIKA